MGPMATKRRAAREEGSSGRPPFPVGWACLVGFVAAAQRIAAGGDALGFALTFLGVIAVLGGIYLYRVRRLDDPKYTWLRKRLAEEEGSRVRRSRDRK
jgi:hypothetical protein